MFIQEATSSLIDSHNLHSLIVAKISLEMKDISIVALKVLTEHVSVRTVGYLKLN